MTVNAGGWLLYVVVVAAILFTGWKEPLRYRFLSRAEIYEIEHPPLPDPATPPPGAWTNDPAHKNPLAPPTRGSR